MIIQVRGTSGSGKSTVIRQVMGADNRWEPVRVDGRRRPLYYRWAGFPRRSWCVLGHYETECGGCDTIGSARQVFDLIHNDLRLTYSTILCEGLLLSEDVKWSSQLEDLRVLFLTTPVDECLRRIEGRRRAKGNAKPLNPHNTTNRVGVIEKARIRLTEAGVYCRRCSDRQAPGIILQWLGAK